MFRYFPKNYVWNLSVDLSIEMGARIGEIEEMCAPLLAASEHPDADGTRAFRDSWSKMADKLCRLAAEDEARGRLLSAGEKYLRAANYYLTCERLQAQGAEGRKALYKRFLDVFAAGLHHSRANCQRVEIPYGDKTLAGLYVRAEGVSGPAPLLLQVNGLDSTKEMKYLVGLPQWLAKRGVSSLVVDQPGTGEALRLHNMKARFDSEHWASRIVDWLEQQPDVDASRALPAAWYGARITTGAMSRSAAWSVKATSRCRTTGTMSAGYGEGRTFLPLCVSRKMSILTAFLTASGYRFSLLTVKKIRRSRLSGRTALTSSWSTARAGS